MTIEQLKAKWVEGYEPTQADYAELFDFFGAGSAGEKTEKITITNPVFNASGELKTELISAPGAGKYIAIKGVNSVAEISEAYNSILSAGISINNTLDFSVNPSAIDFVFMNAADYTYTFPLSASIGTTFNKLIRDEQSPHQANLSNLTDKPVSAFFKTADNSVPTTGVSKFTFFITYEVLDFN